MGFQYFAGAAYRALTAGNMLRKVFIESARPDLETRVPEAAPKAPEAANA